MAGMSRRRAAALRQQRAQAARTPKGRPGPKPDPNRHPNRGDRVWGELRAAQLEREPFCRECAKVAKQTPATEVDHVIPLADGGSFDDPSNHQSLCFRHHWQKDRGRERQAHGTEARKVRGHVEIDPATGMPMPGQQDAHWWSEPE
jgi:hypothetical protein